MKKSPHLFILFLGVFIASHVNVLGQDFENVYNDAVESLDILLAEKALEQATAPSELAKGHFLIGYLQYKEGKYFKSLDHYFTALANYRSTGNYEMQASALKNIGMIYERANFYDQAVDFYTESKLLKMSLSDSEGTLETQFYLAKVYRKSSNYENAIHILGELLKQYKNLESSPGMARVYNEMGLVHLAKEEYSTARKYYNLALDIDVPGKNAGRLVKSYNNIGHAYLQESDYRNALDYFNQALAYYNENNELNKVDNALLFKNLGKVYDSLGSDSAVYFYEKSYDLNAFDETKEEYLDLCIQIKNAYWKKEDMEKAQYFSDQVDNIASNVYSLKQNLNQLYVRYQVEAATYKMERELKTSRLEAQLKQDFIIKCVLAVFLLLLIALIIIVYRKNRRLSFIHSEAVKVYKVLNS